MIEIHCNKKIVMNTPLHFQTMDGSPIDVSNKVALIVNTASHCGFTKQYGELQTLYDTYKDKGFVVIGIPSDNFGGQEFKTEEEVKNFTNEKFSITFPLTAISDVKGKQAHPFYQWASAQVGLLGRPKWNFHKFLLDRQGKLVDWFASTTSPTSNTIKNKVEQELQK